MNEINREKLEILKYKPNKLSSNFALLAILFNTFYVILALRYMDTTNFHTAYRLGILTLVNIFISLLTFLGSSRAKQYSFGWSIYFIVFGIFQIVQINILKKYYITALPKKDIKYVVYFLIISGALAFISGIVGTIRSVRLNSYLRQSKNS